jgi:hypothetical protein
VLDEFSQRYADLVTGLYECVDRIVLNAYYPLGHGPGGFRVWWLRLHDDSDEALDNNQLMRFAGWFARPSAEDIVAESGVSVPIQYSTATAKFQLTSRVDDSSSWNGGHRWETWRAGQRRDVCTT